MKQVVMITGTNRGIGKAMMTAFAKAGYYVVAHARKPSDEHNDAISELLQSGCEIQSIYFDVTDNDAMKKCVKELNGQGIVADILVNNAGITHGGFFSMTKIETIRNVFDVNLFSYMELTQLVLRGMIRKKHGCIINMGSIAGIDLHEGNSAYGVSKSAVIAWTKTLSAEVAQYGIRVNAIAPGLTDTDMAKQMEVKAGEAMLGESAMKRLGHPEEIANTALFLASDNASFINGQTIRVDGGG